METRLPSTSTPTISQAPKDQPKTETRQTLRVAVLGRVGCGKSTISRKFARLALEQKRRVLVVTSHEEEWLNFPLVHPRFPQRIATYVGGRRIVVHSRKAAYEAIGMFRHGLLILDDCRRYLPTSQDDDVEELVISTRQKDVDLLVVCHNFEQLPPVFFTFIDYFFLFPTQGNLRRRKDYFADYDRMEAAVRQINEMGKQDPHTFKIIKNE